MSLRCKNRLIGINAHHKGYRAYGDAYTETYIRLAAALGCSIYRINYNPTTPAMVSYIRSIIDSCHSHGMKVMLALDNLHGSAAEIRDRMVFTAEQLSDCVDYFQIFNETDIWCAQTDENTFYDSSDWTGMSTEYYNPERVKICIEKMKAAIGAFRETAPDAKLAVNIGSRHYPMLDWYIEAGLSWDIIAFDIYEIDLWDHAQFFDSMAARYPGYDFMVAECNYPANDGPYTEEEQAEWLHRFLTIMDSYESDRMLGVIIYELMDQPNIETDGTWSGEAHFGIVNTNPDYSPGEPKSAYYTVQKLLLGNT